MRFLQPRFRKARPADRDLLPWWHPASLLRAAWNLIFSAALGIGIGAIVLDLAAQIAGKITGSDWKEWHDPLSPLAWVIGCFVAVIAYMSYRMDDKTDA
ncbi:hypothetical protein [Ferrovibrio terrae]|uniref:hypothetical protein n=1 Tax=Ferrovibrio terrae TaxID=2594003 RepID=UPI003137915F